MLYGLDLFSGIGGITLALKQWVKPIAYCELDSYCQAILLSRQAKGDLPIAPIWDDVRTLKGEYLPEQIDIIYGGFPCQDISCANPNGKGLEGERSGLFFEICRLADELRPTFIFLENVPAVKKLVPQIRAELEGLDFDCRDGFLSAGDLGAKMRQNNRWFLLAKTKSERIFFADAKSKGCPGQAKKKWGPQTTRYNHKSNSSNWAARANKVYRGAYGISTGVDQLRALGNAVVPIQAKVAFEILIGIKPPASE